MPTIQNQAPTAPLGQAQPVRQDCPPDALATHKPIVPAVEEDPCDTQVFQTLKQGSANATIAGTLVTLPNEALKATDTITHVAQVMQARAATHASSKVLATAALLTSKTAHSSQFVSKGANALISAPLLGKLMNPRAAEVVNNQVMPVINGVASGVGIVENSVRFQRARVQHDTAGQVVSGIQIGLNTVSGISGFLKGKGPMISAVTGFASLALEGYSSLTGVGKVKER